MQEKNISDGFYIGLMSGTSLDGIDAVCAQFISEDSGQALRSCQAKNMEHIHIPMPLRLQQCFRKLNEAGFNELHDAAVAANELVDCYAQAVHRLCQKAGLLTSDIVAIGAHGQTVRHHPNADKGQDDTWRYSIQLNNPARLAELTDITVVADFRSRDIAAGGQGAPLVPAFHRAMFFKEGQAAIALLNLGGIANLSVINANGATLGFDCGPANTLLDAWAQRHLGQAYDANGAWATSGKVSPELLTQLIQDAYFDTPPPKSTGLEYFNLAWLNQYLNADCGHKPQDVQATLAQLTAQICAQDLLKYGADVERLGVCGGGAYNDDLLARLKALLAPKVKVQTTQEWGVKPECMEGAAFAWLARQCLLGLPGSFPEVTQAKGARILGGIYLR